MYTVTNEHQINLRATGIERVLQNVANILRTIEGELPLGRSIGLKSFIDKPLGSIRGDLIKEIIKKVERFEPRASVKKVELSEEIDKIKITLGVEVLRIE